VEAEQKQRKKIEKNMDSLSGVFKGRWVRHLPRAPLIRGATRGVPRVNFPHFWRKTYYPLI